MIRGMSGGDDAGERAVALARRLNALPEPRMRRRALADYMSDPPARERVIALRALVAALRSQPTPAIAEALETLTATLSEPELIPYAVRAELYEAAKLEGCDEIARMLFEAPVTAAAGDEDPAAERPLRPRGRPLTLGERKSLARGHVRTKLEALLRDPHPDVVEILLGNPHLTERDVVFIATRRPAAPRMLELVATSEKWSSRYAVKRALVLNPYTPAHLSVRLLTTLQAVDLRAVGADANLPEPVREQALALLDR